MSKVHDYYESRHELCKSCDRIIPDWSFLCPICFCEETKDENN